jgi:hypothetical protein
MEHGRTDFLGRLSLGTYKDAPSPAEFSFAYKKVIFDYIS